MKQSVLVAPRQSRIDERPVPRVGEGDVLVKVRACGICTSELPGWSGDNGSYPREIGHEVAGEVVAVSLVTDRFALDHVDDAFRALLTKPPGFIKAVIVSDQ